MVSIKQRYLIEAGANGHTDLEHYIEALKSECSRLHINLITMQKLVNQQQGLTGLEKKEAPKTEEKRES